MNEYEAGDMMVDALRRANPVPLAEMGGRRASASADALFADIVAHRPRRVPTRVLVIATAIVLLVALLVAFVVVRREHASLPLGTSCYAAADLEAPLVVAPSTENPASVCAQLWKSGRLGSGPVPNFDTCVLPSGLIGVFPGESGSVCARLGLAEAASDGDIAAFAEAVNAEVSSECIKPDAAQQILERERAKRGITGWTITRAVDPFDDAHPCASFFFDVPSRTITIVPQPDPFTTSPSTAP